MKVPKMILFDYGHTLLCESGFNGLKGWEALFPYINSNPSQAGPAQAAELMDSLFNETRQVRALGFELHEWQYMRLVFEYFGFGLDISLKEAEITFANAAASAFEMPGAASILDTVNAMGIRSAVISNIAWSQSALKERIDRLLPRNRFEFIITSSEYLVRKPNPLLFQLALNKAGISPQDAWYCGDRPDVDAKGAFEAGMFPVWYDSDIDCFYRDRTKEAAPDFPHLHIKDWGEMAAKLKSLRP
jgi:putative hydrolase of the HAD superfamily